ncbi:hypothetical protein [Arenibaculum sp.]|uniref:hypothetical protein n=1 Tax=Arenibaculum sp. TaxID=2865862 RepID=UPI002E0FEB8C|nr:hypothetical protein [Arenibaculum sp.]
MTTTADRPLPPHIELFCRVAAAGGVSLAEAARRAGCAPGSAPWAHADVRARLAELSAEEENRHEALVERMRRQHDELYGKLIEQGHFPAAARLLTHRWRFEKDVDAVRTMTRAERERLREDLREDLREEVRAELLAELRQELHAGTVTNHDDPARPDAPTSSVCWPARWRRPLRTGPAT